MTILQLFMVSTPFEVERREKRGRRKIIVGAPSCRVCQHAQAHNVESG